MRTPGYLRHDFFSQDIPIVPRCCLSRSPVLFDIDVINGFNVLGSFRRLPLLLLFPAALVTLFLCL